MELGSTALPAEAQSPLFELQHDIIHMTNFISSLGTQLTCSRKSQLALLPAQVRVPAPGDDLVNCTSLDVGSPRRYLELDDFMWLLPYDGARYFEDTYCFLFNLIILVSVLFFIHIKSIHVSYKCDTWAW